MFGSTEEGFELGGGIGGGSPGVVSGADVGRGVGSRTGVFAGDGLAPGAPVLSFAGLSPGPSAGSPPVFAFGSPSGELVFPPEAVGTLGLTPCSPTPVGAPEGWTG